VTENLLVALVLNEVRRQTSGTLSQSLHENFNDIEIFYYEFFLKFGLHDFWIIPRKLIKFCIVFDKVLDILMMAWLMDRSH